jgi:hypothetical protein
MSWRLCRHDVGSARMILALRGCHGGFAAMMWASPTRHPGSARMILALRGCHGGFAAMINFIHISMAIKVTLHRENISQK